MLANVERLVDLVGSRESGLVGASLTAVEDAVQAADIARLQSDKMWTLWRRSPR